MQNYELNVKVKLDSNDIDDIVCVAFEGGINYWCRKAEVVGAYLGNYASEQISKGGSVILYDGESDDKWELNLENFLKGLQLYLEKNSNSIVKNGMIDTYNVDAEIADMIIQYALFGELVFG